MREKDTLGEEECASGPTQENADEGSGNGDLSTVIGDDRNPCDEFHNSSRIPKHEDEEKKTDSSPLDISSTIDEAIKALSPENLEQKTNQIIQEAQLETLRKRFNKSSSRLSTVHSRRKHDLQQALDRAAAAGRAEAAEADEFEEDTSDLYVAPRRRLDIEASKGPDGLPSTSFAGRPPLSPTTPSSDVARITGSMHKALPNPTAHTEQGSEPHLSFTDSVGSIDDEDVAMKR